jgi:cytochrome c2
LNLQALEREAGQQARSNQPAPAFNKTQSFLWMLAHLQSFLDMPMVVIFGTFMFLVLIHYVHDQ